MEEGDWRQENEANPQFPFNTPISYFNHNSPTLLVLHIEHLDTIFFGGKNILLLKAILKNFEHFYVILYSLSHFSDLEFKALNKKENWLIKSLIF